MKNFVQSENYLTITAPYDRLSGQGVMVGSLFGVCQIDALSAALLPVAMTGVFTLAKATGTAWVVGDVLYWDDTAKNVAHTSNSGANKRIGVCTAAAASGDTTGQIRLDGHAV